jgi:phosphoribosylamine--glycine ligase
MDETVLLVGGGGREHAIARSLADSEASLYACAGNRNPGIARLAEGFGTLETTNPTAVRSYAEEVDATLAIVGPEAPLAAGVADALDDAGVYAFGPQEAEARIETDKAFQRRFMQQHDIPGCPDFETFDDMEAACKYIDEYDGDLAVKPAGLTGGKGVRVIGDQVTAEEAKEYIRESDYDRIVLEERLVGEEFTVQAFVANGQLRVTPAVQDHKRAYEGDEGPNTGGMGSYSDATLALPFMTEDEYMDAVDVLRETVASLEGYKGVLYGQFMLTVDGVKVVEFNARFGDPEAMNTLPVMQTDLLDVLVAARKGEALPKLRFSREAHLRDPSRSTRTAPARRSSSTPALTSATMVSTRRRPGRSPSSASPDPSPTPRRLRRMRWRPPASRGSGSVTTSARPTSYSGGSTTWRSSVASDTQQADVPVTAIRERDTRGGGP